MSGNEYCNKCSELEATLTLLEQSSKLEIEDLRYTNEMLKNVINEKSEHLQQLILHITNNESGRFKDG